MEQTPTLRPASRTATTLSVQPLSPSISSSSPCPPPNPTNPAQIGSAHLAPQLLAQPLVLAVHQLLGHVRVKRLTQGPLASHIKRDLVKLLVLFRCGVIGTEDRYRLGEDTTKQSQEERSLRPRHQADPTPPAPPALLKRPGRPRSTPASPHPLAAVLRRASDGDELRKGAPQGGVDGAGAALRPQVLVNRVLFREG